MTQLKENGQEEITIIRSKSLNAQDWAQAPKNESIPNPESDSLPEYLSNYQFGDTIGRGTFGAVKSATHWPSGEKVAIKIMSKQYIKDVADFERLQRELHILRNTNHPSIVKLYQIIETKRYLFIIMENCVGGELYNRILAEKRLDEMTAAQIFVELIYGVKYLHSLRIAHRDLKLENLLLDDQGRIKIADFGLSATYKPDELLETACGSPCYAAPEMIKGKHYYPELADIWSCGIILYAMVCGYLPFEDDSTALLYQKIIKGKFDYPEHISSNLSDLISQILVVNPEGRISSEKILQHPWLLHNASQWIQDYAPSLASNSVSPQLDMILLEEIARDYNLDKGKLACSLKIGQGTFYTTLYWLLLNARTKNLRLLTNQRATDYLQYNMLDQKQPTWKEPCVSDGNSMDITSNHQDESISAFWLRKDISSNLGGMPEPRLRPDSYHTQALSVGEMTNQNRQGKTNNQYTNKLGHIYKQSEQTESQAQKLEVSGQQMQKTKYLSNQATKRKALAQAYVKNLSSSQAAAGQFTQIHENKQLGVRLGQRFEHFPIKIERQFPKFSKQVRSQRDRVPMAVNRHLNISTRTPVVSESSHLMWKDQNFPTPKTPFTIHPYSLNNGQGTRTSIKFRDRSRPGQNDSDISHSEVYVTRTEPSFHGIGGNLYRNQETLTQLNTFYQPKRSVANPLQISGMIKDNSSKIEPIQSGSAQYELRSLLSQQTAYPTSLNEVSVRTVEQRARGVLNTVLSDFYKRTKAGSRQGHTVTAINNISLQSNWNDPTKVWPTQRFPGSQNRPVRSKVSTVKGFERPDLTDKNHSFAYQTKECGIQKRSEFLPAKAKANQVRASDPPAMSKIIKVNAAIPLVGSVPDS